MSEKERTLFRREHIGFIYQSFNLLPTLTVEDNLRLGSADASEDEIIAACRAANALEFIQALPQGFATIIGGIYVTFGIA